MESDNEEAAIFDLDAEPRELLRLAKDAIEESEKYWNSDSKFNLKNQTAENLRLWLPDHHWNNSDLYEHQEINKYVDPRIFTNTETAVELINSRVPQPEVAPAQDTETSRQLARDVSDALYAYCKKFHINDLFKVNTRNHIIKRRSFLKLRFDENIGQHGEIITEVVLPEDIIIDKDAKMTDNPRFIAQRIRNKTCQELIAQMPESEQEILKSFGVSRTNKRGELIAQYTQMRKQKDIWEVWFTHFDKDTNEPTECVLWCDDKFLHLYGAMRNPNFNYEGDDTEDESAANFLDLPPKPFVWANHLNDGSSIIDLTSLVEQSKLLQQNLDRRGYQIADNLDQSGSGIVYNVEMIGKEEMRELIGSPEERVGVKGDVRAAFMRVPPPVLPAAVYQDKDDSRASLDNVFGTHEQSRGATSSNATLGQDVMQQNSDMNRQNGLVSVNTTIATRFYRLLCQFMKVYYTEDHWFKLKGEDGQFDHIAMSNDKIEDGIDIEVESGSQLPMDTVANKETAKELAAMQMIDPLTVYEAMTTGQLPTPRKMLERYTKFTTDPIGYAAAAEVDNVNREAMMDIQILENKVMPKPRKNISPEYLKHFNQYMISGEFQELEDDVKQLFIDHVRKATEIANQLMQAAMTQAPTPEEMAARNQATIEQSTMDQAIQAAQPQPQMGANGEQPPADQGPQAQPNKAAKSIANQEPVQ